MINKNSFSSVLTLPGLRELAFQRDALGFLSSLAARDGDFCEFRLGRQTFFLVNEQSLARAVLVTKQHKFRKGPGLQRAKRLLGEGLLTSEGEYHRRQRQLIQPAFHRQQLSGYADSITGCALRRQTGWQDGQELDIHTEMKRLTLMVVGETMLGTDVQAEADEIGDLLGQTIEMLTPRASPAALLKSLRRKLGVLPNRFPQLRGRIDEIVGGIIAKRRMAGESGDLLSMLLQLRDEEGALTDAQVRDEVMTLVQAGHETTANALTWAWVLLSEHPSAGRKLHDEIDGVLNGRRPSAGDVASLVYTNAVFMETLRLYPPAWVLSRSAIEDVELDGRVVPRGAVVLVAPYLLHRRPDVYERPLEFYPERWLVEGGGGGEEAAAPMFLPFGLGPRRCIGEGFAMMESVLVIAVLASKWRMRLSPGCRVEIDPRITLRPKNRVRVVLEKRELHPA